MIYVLYHKFCADGSGAAYAAYKKFGDAAIYVPMAYHDPLPEILNDSEIYILDYSRPWQELLHLIDRGCRITWIDHHKSALADALCLFSAVKGTMESFTAKTTVEAFKDSLDFRSLSKVKRNAYLKESGLWALTFEADNLMISFNLRNSGAVLAWLYFHATPTLPDLLSYVQDRDLWKFLLPNSKAHSEGLFAYLTEQKERRHHEWRRKAALELYSESPNEKLFDGFHPNSSSGFIPELLNNIVEGTRRLATTPQSEALAELQVWDQLAEMLNSDRQALLVAKGNPILERKNEEVQEIVKTATWGCICGHQIPIVQSSKYRSEIGHALCNAFPEALFAATWKEDGQVQSWDLRSNHGFDCAALAETLGGGGHAPAAGFRLYRLGNLEVGDLFVGIASMVQPIEIGSEDIRHGFIWEVAEPGGIVLASFPYADRSAKAALPPSSEFVRISPDIAQKWVIKLKS